jgi:uncharacterized membrane protein
MNRSSTYIILLLATTCWCLGIVLPAWLAATGSALGSSVSREMYQFYSHICHQFDTRSLHLFGHKFAVCARCTAIYVGFLAGGVLSPLATRSIRDKSLSLMALAVVPMIADVGCDLVNIHASTITTRLITGGIFGVGAALFLVPLLVEACSELTTERISNRGVSNESEA